MHTNHYQADGLECIEVMEHVFGREACELYARMNAFKYLWRAGRKEGNSIISEMDKVVDYSKYAIEQRLKMETDKNVQQY